MKKLILAIAVLILTSCSPAYANSTCDGMWTEHSLFQLTGSHAQGKCSCASCHIGGFQPGSAGGGATCGSCHLGSRPAAKMKGNGHITTSQDCSVCHAGIVTFDNAKMNHTGITTGCASCHRKSNSHPTTTNNCETCHNTNPGGWKCISGKFERWLKSFFV